MGKLDLMVTLWPSFPHFSRFVYDGRLAGIRLNSAMMSGSELDHELELVSVLRNPTPLYFDVKGRQLRVTEVHFNTNFLDITLNHPIKVELPAPVLFKAGADDALLLDVIDGGRRLIFDGGPQFEVLPGESLHIRHPSLKVYGPTFLDAEIKKIEKVKAAGFTRYFLSYVENQRDVDEFLEIVGHDSEVMLKIENQKGLDYIVNVFTKRPNIKLVAARGDLYVELSKPHQIMDALKLIIEKDSEACLGSRILLSVVAEPTQLMTALKLMTYKEPGSLADTRILRSVIGQPVPACADFLELAWLYDIGYRSMMLCDEICLRGDLLSIAVNAFEAFKSAYVPK